MIEAGTFDISVDFHGVKGLVFIGKQVVLIRRDNKTNKFPLHVDLPGGGRDLHETPFETFKREIHEELGLVLEQNDIIFSKTYASIDNPLQKSYFMVTRPLSATVDDIIFGDEGLEFLLMTPEQYINLPDGIKRHQDRIFEYLSSIHNNYL